MTWRVEQGDCVEHMAGMDPESVDAIVTDPPYGLEFMGKDWDELNHNNGFTAEVAENAENGGRARGTGMAAQAWHGLWAAQALRVLKPGGYLLAFGGTRTYHRLVCALEDAGFEIRDTICWLHGQGFPKSLDVSKAIDKAAGAERPVVGTDSRPAYDSAYARWENEYPARSKHFGQGEWALTASATEGARQWQGWGTALKPAFEPIVVARKPLSERNVAANVLKHGTGGINVDGCRLGFAGVPDEQESKDKNRHADFHSGPRANKVFGKDMRSRSAAGNYDPPGRWPANVVFDEEAAAMLDEQSGERRSGGDAHLHQKVSPGYGGGWGLAPRFSVRRDRGGASRFFYCAKASRAEREAGLEGLPARTGAQAVDRQEGTADLQSPRAGAGRTAERVRNHHPTVKPVSLMRWLVRLVTPPGGLVLDPFVGSGTTGMACVWEGFRFIGIEKDAGYCEIARLRIKQAEIDAAGPLFKTTPAEGATL